MRVQDIEPSEPVTGFCDRVFQRRIVGHVKAERMGLTAASSNLGSNGSGAVRIEIAHHHGRAVSGKGQRPGPADP
jgi:hypothetical protein